jgi:hypothetical protein
MKICDICKKEVDDGFIDKLKISNANWLEEKTHDDISYDREYDYDTICYDCSDKIFRFLIKLKK